MGTADVPPFNACVLSFTFPSSPTNLKVLSVNWQPFWKDSQLGDDPTAHTSDREANQRFSADSTCAWRWLSAKKRCLSFRPFLKISLKARGSIWSSEYVQRLIDTSFYGDENICLNSIPEQFRGCGTTDMPLLTATIKAPQLLGAHPIVQVSESKRSSASYERACQTVLK